jgi:signal transduction histidine kinase/ligand-binding sensor domain-containing protein
VQRAWASRQLFFLLCFLQAAGARALAADSSNALESAAKEYLVKIWDGESGLPQIAVTSLAQTPDSYLWLGTFLNVSRFDGLRFTVFDHSNAAIPGPIVLRLLTDKNGALWAGTDQGIARYQHGRWESFRNAPGWPGGLVRTLLEAPNGDLIVGLETALFRFRDGRFEPLPLPDRGELSKEPLTCTIDSEGQLWVCSYHYFGVFSDGKWTDVLRPPELGSQAFLGLRASKQGGVWLANITHIRRYHRGQWVQEFKRPPGFEDDPVVFLEDSAGHLWTGGYTKGVIVYRKDGRVLRCTLQDGLENNATLSLFEDHESNIWIGSNGGGLARLKPRTCTVFDANLAQPIINSMVEIEPGKFFVGTHGSGLMRFEGERFTGAVAPDVIGLGGVSWIHAVTKDRQGVVWAGTYGEGVFRIEGQNKPEKIPVEKTGHPTVFSLYADSRDRLWVGTARNVARLQGNSWQILGPTNGIPVSFYSGIGEDEHGKVWVASIRSGLFREEQDGFVAYSGPAEQVPGRVISIFRSRNGTMWTGSFSGKLGRWRDNKFFIYDGKHGLPIFNITVIQEDDAGDLWIGGTEGIARITRASLEGVASGSHSRLETLLFDKSDGMRVSACRDGFTPMSAKSSDGRLWFATLKGMVAVNPRQVLVKSIPPPTWIEEIILDGKGRPVAPGSTEPELIPPGTKRIQIRFTGVHLGSPERVSFEYWLEGLDTDWLPIETRTAQFQDLRPGTYTFHVRASNREGLKRQMGQTLSFTVLPFFWQTAWFRILVAIAALGIVGGFAWRVHQNRLHRQAEAALKKAYLELERRVQERTAELKQARDHLEKRVQERTADLEATNKELEAFSYSVSHDLRSPLRHIIGFSQILQEQMDSSADERERKYVRLICQSAQRMAQLVDDLLAFSRYGRAEMRQVTIDLNAVVRNTLQTLDQDIQGRALVWTIESLPQIKGDPTMVQQVFENLISNALKYTRPCKPARIEIRCQTTEDEWILSIRDNGVGFDMEYSDKLFGVFQRLHPPEEFEGTGIGLANVRRIVQRHGGRTWAQGKVGEGAIFYFTFPKHHSNQNGLTASRPEAGLTHAASA